MHYGDRLRLSREKKEIIQRDVANIIGIANTTLSGYENGRYEPPFDVLIKLSDLYNVPVDYIIRGTTSRMSVAPKIQSLIDDIIFLSDLDITLVQALVERLKQK